MQLRSEPPVQSTEFPRIAMNNADHYCNQITPLFTRRDILKNFSCGFGYLAFASLATGVAAALGMLRRISIQFKLKA